MNTIRNWIHSSYGIDSDNSRIECFDRQPPSAQDVSLAVFEIPGDIKEAFTVRSGDLTILVMTLYYVSYQWSLAHSHENSSILPHFQLSIVPQWPQSARNKYLIIDEV